MNSARFDHHVVGSHHSHVSAIVNASEQVVVRWIVLEYYGSAVAQSVIYYVVDPIAREEAVPRIFDATRLLAGLTVCGGLEYLDVEHHVRLHFIQIVHQLPAPGVFGT